MSISGGSEETHSLVFKKLQSSVRPEVLEELMDRREWGFRVVMNY